MSLKRTRDEGVANTGGDGDGDARSKKPRHGFRVGPENLPDGPWRRKVTKIKHNLITKAKVKKQYAKVKAEFQQQEQQNKPVPTDDTANEASSGTHAEEEGTAEDAPAQIHPERQAMLDDPDAPADQDDGQKEGDTERPRWKERRQQIRRRPDYFEKELAESERLRAEAAARQAEVARREKEKAKRIAERERYRNAMAKAKAPGKDGKRKLGRESRLLLDKVKRIVGDA